MFMAFYLQYPKEPPHVCAVESKGLDENRQAYLISSIQNKAKELSDYPMLVTLCEVFLVFCFMYSREKLFFHTIVFQRIFPTCMLAEELKHSIVACVFGVPSALLIMILHLVHLSNMQAVKIIIAILQTMKCGVFRKYQMIICSSRIAELADFPVSLIMFLFFHMI
jgi:hypothetical protein